MAVSLGKLARFWKVWEPVAVRNVALQQFLHIVILKTRPMSRQLAFSATVSLAAMALFVLSFAAGVPGGQAKGANAFASAPSAMQVIR